jgi:hypothetical protein
MRILRPNWYGFDHAAVNEKFGGELTYFGDSCIGENYAPWAIYRAANPDRSKNHKDFMFVKTDGLGEGIVSGLNAEHMEDILHVDGLWCLLYDTAVYSCMRHHNQSCKCGSVSIDSGRDYIRISHEELPKFVHCKIDLLNKKISYKKRDLKSALKTFTKKGRR